MKKIYYLFIFVFCTFFYNIVSVKGQAGCDLNLIRSTFTGAGCTELTSCLSSCSMYFYNPLSQTGSAAQAWAQNYGAGLISMQSATENACIISELNTNGFGGTIWIGFNDEANEGSFVWYDQSPVIYTHWNGGEPNNSGNEDCTQIYADGYWNDLPCNSSGSKSVIEVNLCPVTTITPSATTICAGGNVSLPTTTFLGSSPYTYSWTSIPAGFTSTSATPTATPTVTTQYDVTATDRYGCLSQSSVTIIVNSPSTVITPSGPISFCPGGTVDLTADAATSYSWSNGATTQSITVTATGSFTVVVTDANSCTAASAPTAVTLFVNPSAAFTNTNVCFQNATLFTDNSTISSGNIASWNWTFGDGSSSPLPSLSHIYSACGVFNVKLVVTANTGCKDSISKTSRVFCLPVADFSFTDVCLNQTMNFMDLSMPADSITSWSWNFGDGSPSGTGQNLSHTYTNAGPYSVSLTATSNNGCKDTVVKNVVVHPLPDAKFNTTNVCNGNTVTFSDISTIPTPDIIQLWGWGVGDGNPAYINQTASHLYSAPGSYSVKLITVSNFGCLDSIIKTVIVHPNPVVNFIASDTTGCAPLCISFQDLSSVSPGTVVQWAWNVGDGGAVISSKNFDHCYANTSVSSTLYFSVTLTATSDSGCVTTLSKNNYITAYPNPVADFVAQPSKTNIIAPVISFINTSTGADFWSWDFGDLQTALIENPPAHTYGDTGTYLVRLITATQYACIDTAYQTVIIEPEFVFYIPEAFSPNGDLKNDTFSGKGLFIKEYEMLIFDRWGNLTFKTTDVNEPWDGKANKGSSIAEVDVYIYSFKITDIKNDVYFFKGTVTLLR
ncbi:MAG: PKD domain-containing protein [Bacteroidota bacterium]